jgi:hypothetical protein
MDHQLEQQGFALIPDVLSVSDRERLIDALQVFKGAGRRGLLGHSAVAQFARSTRILEMVRPHLPCEPHPVRALYFTKSPDTNWLVPSRHKTKLVYRLLCKHSTVEQMLSNPGRGLHSFDFSFPPHCCRSRWMNFGPDELPGTVFAGEL